MGPDLSTDNVALEACEHRADFREKTWPVCPCQLDDIVISCSGNAYRSPARRYIS
uniref:Uncharacterized protein n=1 Tax=Arundo donax TaxID=35708 RepID=A0A0A9CXQ2_ARUDO